MILHPDVAKALQLSLPVVALESAVITHGLPHPINLELAQHLEDVIRQNGAAPATIALLEGELHIGITNEELQSLAAASNPVKISRRDFAPAMTQKRTGGTTVAGTMIAAHRAGIRVFATGGIGGVHRGTQFDVSADLPELARTPLVVVCAGAKAVLDLPATVEYLETMGVPMIGYQTDEFPAFYSQSSGIKIPFRVETPVEIARIAKQHWRLGMKSAILVVQPVPKENELPRDEVETIIQRALEDAHIMGITGAAVTPFLLGRVGEISAGATLKANLALLENNALLSARIASSLEPQKGPISI